MVNFGKLGCKKPDPVKLLKALPFRRYFSSSRLPAPTVSTNRRERVKNWGMLANDRLGCCTESSTGHIQMLWGASSGISVCVTDAGIIEAYSRVSGYNSQTGANDNGAQILDVLNDWRKSGVCGNRLGAYASIKPTDHLGIIESIYLFGATSCGVALPIAWQGKAVWEAPSDFHAFDEWAPGSWGGHCVPIIDYDALYVYVLSWGQVIPVTWAAVSVYFFEVYALLNELWVTGQRQAPNGFDLDALQRDLVLVTESH